jgi:hypothetical protein
VDVIEGGEGSVTVPIAARGAVQTADFSNTPNYIGDYEADGEHRRLSLKLSLRQPALLAVNVASLAGSCDHSRIAIGSFEAPVAVGTLYVAVPAAATIEIRGGDDLCYAVLGGITVHPPQSAIAPSQLPGAPG